mgnify:FL=1
MKAVRMGDVQTINDTLEARVIPSAVFSVRKYIVPPHSPAKSNKNSSLILLAKNFLREMLHIQI